MNNQDKSKEQLIEDIAELNKQLHDLKVSQAKIPPQTSQDDSQEEFEFKTLVEHSPDLIMRFDKSIRFLYANLLAIKILEIPAASYLGKTIRELNLTGKYYDYWNTHVKNVFTTQKSYMFEGEFTCNNGQHYFYHARIVPEFDKNGKIKSALCTVRNINDLKKYILALKTSEERNRKILTSFPDLMFYISNDGKYLDSHIANPALLYKPLESVIGNHISDILPPEQSTEIMTAIKRAIKNNKVQIIKYQLPINNTACFFEARIIKCNADSVMCIIRDITEIKHLKQELTRLDQLNLVGEMAASIGHEVRNPLTTVRGFLQMLSLKDQCVSFKDYFNLMIEELDRANSIISEFLSLAKNKIVKLEQQNLNNIIKTITPLIESNAIMSDKYLKLDLAVIPNLLLDAQEIRQLILNLVRNGLEAMPPHTTMTIKTFIENRKVVMAIEDSGTGIPPELLSKLGKPFFTTKEKGTGLGLAICYSIVARHKATIKVSTSPHGTTFFIKFNQ